ncbi:hypothetical protein [Rhodococcus jostii]|uniref:hypothetical protein n=1 Tax=Rhodococcus TaxID=1827 RepID=UPI001ED94FFF|nr:hypothetical protein [Rhodococcus jostii]
MRRPRWPATAPPACGGVQVHGRRLLAADIQLTLELLRVVAYPSGLAHLTLTATGCPAERARHETRPLTDPAEPSAHWSYLDVWAGTDDLAVADTRASTAPIGRTGPRGHAVTGPSRCTG